MTRIAIFHPADPLGHVPGGIDTIIRGVLKWAPEDLDYTLFGATSDPVERPTDQEVLIHLGGRPIRYVPLINADPSSTRGFVPLTVRYMWALRRYLQKGRLRHLDVLDFHRIEALALFTRDPRPKNVMIHQDMAVIRNKDADIGWRHAPWLYELIEPRLFRTTNRIFCVRQSAVTRYRKTYPALADRFSFLPTWVDTSVFYSLESASERQNQRQLLGHRYGIADSAEILVWVGRLDRQKDPMLLLNAMKVAVKSHPQAHLLMVGDGNMRQQVEAHIELLKLDGHVSLCGAIPPQQIAEILQVASLFVLSSAYEGMPIVVLEALATGVPVVTTDVGEVRLVVQDGIDGFVVTDRSPEELGRGISNALKLGDSMRGQPCEQAVSAYTPNQVLRQIYDNHRRQAARKTR